MPEGGEDEQAHAHPEGAEDEEGPPAERLNELETGEGADEVYGAEDNLREKGGWLSPWRRGVVQGRPHCVIIHQHVEDSVRCSETSFPE